MTAIPNFSAFVRHLHAQQATSRSPGGTFRIASAAVPDDVTPAWAFLNSSLQVVTVEYADGHLEVLMSENVAETRLGAGLASGRVFP
jgi:hypothetical protein